MSHICRWLFLAVPIILLALSVVQEFSIQKDTFYPKSVPTDPKSVPTDGDEQENTVRSRAQRVYRDKILDGNGEEVIWRGVGASYLFHSGDYIAAWNLHLPEMKAMGLNTLRLCFRFPFDNVSSADLLDYGKLDEVLSLLDENNIKAILNNHGGVGFGSLELIYAWKELALRYSKDVRIVAYELFNEPYASTCDARRVKSREDVAESYRNLTREIREIDSDHIHIWQSSQYLPPLDTIREYLEPNIVFTVHRWWTNRPQELEIWTPKELSYLTMAYIIEMREELRVPFWFGEFGAHAFNEEWLLAEQIVHRCEEQAVGWSLWMGRVDKNQPWNHYLGFFPLKIYNQELFRHPWQQPSSNVEDYVVEQFGVDFLEFYRIEMRQYYDYVILSPRITILVIISERLQGNSVEFISEERIEVTELLKVSNDPPFEGDLRDFHLMIYML